MKSGPEIRLIAAFGQILPVLVAAFLVAALISLVATPIIVRVATRLGFVDEPNHRRVNANPVPRGGGIAVAVAFLLVATVVVVVNEQLDIVPDPNRPETSTFLAVMAGGFLAMLLGLLDDALQLRARWQLLTQIAVTAIPLAAGVTVVELNNPVGPGTIPLGGLFGAGFTVVWILGMINSINFIDGLDGLSSGIALIAAVTLALGPSFVFDRVAASGDVVATRAFLSRMAIFDRLIPGLFVTGAVFGLLAAATIGFNLLGDGLREALDPRLRR